MSSLSGENMKKTQYKMATNLLNIKFAGSPDRQKNITRGSSLEALTGSSTSTRMVVGILAYSGWMIYKGKSPTFFGAASVGLGALWLDRWLSGKA